MKPNSDSRSDPGIPAGAVERACGHARQLFLRDDNRYGCAETVYMTLKRLYGLADADNSDPAIALNGGVAHTGGMCGALLGAALALGQRQKQLTPDHRQAKSEARTAVRVLLERFEREFQSCTCRDLTGFNIADADEHRRFIESGIWRTRCMQQIEYVVKSLCPPG